MVTIQIFLSTRPHSQPHQSNDTSIIVAEIVLKTHEMFTDIQSLNAHLNEATLRSTAPPTTPAVTISNVSVFNKPKEFFAKPESIESFIGNL